MDDFVSCWACRAQLPHEHRSAVGCPHEPSDGVPASCCADFDSDRLELRGLAFNIRTGRAAVPDTPAGIGLVADD